MPKYDDQYMLQLYQDGINKATLLGYKGKAAVNFAERYVMQDPQYGTVSLPEFTYQRTDLDKARLLGKQVRNTTDQFAKDYILTPLEIGTSFTPFWALPVATKTGLALSKGNYKDAAIEAGSGLVAPYALGKVVIPGAIKGYRFAKNQGLFNNKDFLLANAKQVTPYVKDAERFLKDASDALIETGKWGYHPYKNSYSIGSKWERLRYPTESNWSMRHEFGHRIAETEGLPTLYNPHYEYADLWLATNFNNSVNKKFTNYDELFADKVASTTGKIPSKFQKNDQLFQQRVWNSLNTTTENPGNPHIINYQPTTNTAKTSLAFLERPSKLTAAEKLGIPKGDRGNLSLNLLQAINDLLDYINNGLYNQVFRVTPDWEDFGWNLSRDNLSFMQLFAKDKMTMNNRFWARVLLETPTGKGVVGWNPEANMASYSSRSFAIPETFDWAPGEAVMNLDGTNGHLIILTAPKTDFLSSMMDDEFKLIGLSLSPTIDKKIMKDFWINARKAQRPGTYLSGDNGRLPLGNYLIEAFKNKKLYKTPIYENPLSEQFVLRTGLSPDSYSSIIRQGNRDNTLRWGEGFAKWNDSAITNKYIYDAFLNYKKGNISAEEYEKIFNDWSLNLGGRPLLWGVNSEGIKYPIHPHPYLYKRKQGGKLNYITLCQNHN